MSVHYLSMHYLQYVRMPKYIRDQCH